MLNKNILIVDDEFDLCEILKFNLEHEGAVVDTVGSAEDALALLKDHHYHLILLDVMMTGLSGFKMAEQLRKEQNNNTPIIFLTARDTENDMLTGFSVGGDDYIFKPFSIKEVVARTKAIIKRTGNKDVASTDSLKDNHILQLFDLEIDLNSKRVLIDEKPIALTKTEFEILHHLAKHEGKILSREEIMRIVWPNDTYVLERTVDVHVARLRKKLNKYSHWIKNRSGYGYCLDTNEKG